jgi:hypothetical protein
MTETVQPSDECNQGKKTPVTQRSDEKPLLPPQDLGGLETLATNTIHTILPLFLALMYLVNY